MNSSCSSNHHPPLHHVKTATTRRGWASRPRSRPISSKHRSSLQRCLQLELGTPIVLVAVSDIHRTAIISKKAPTISLWHTFKSTCSAVFVVRCFQASHSVSVCPLFANSITNTSTTSSTVFAAEDKAEEDVMMSLKSDWTRYEWVYRPKLPSRVFHPQPSRGWAATVTNQT